MGVVIPQVVTEDRAGGAQSIEGSLRFDSSKSHYLSRTPGSAGNRRTWTWSGWVKRSGGNEPGIFSSWAGSNPSTTLYFNVDNRLVFYDYNSVYRINLLTTQVFRDFSSWYHIVVAVDTTAATSTDRAKIYVNGVQIKTFDTATYPALNWETNWNSVKEHNLGKHVNYQEGSITNIYLIDGQALTPSYFGYTDPLTNTWRPKKYTESLREAEGSGNNAWNQEYTNSCLGFYFNDNPPIWLGRLRRTGSTSYASAVTFGTSTGVSLSSGDTLMWAYDESAAKLWVGRNGTWYASGDPANGTNPTFAGFSTTALLFKTLYYEDSGVSNGSDLYLTRITSGSASYSTPSGFSYWDGMNLNWRYGGGSTSSTSRADYIPQRITGKVYFETTVHWTGSGAWADYRIAGLSDEGNANINSFYLPFDGSAPIGQDRSNNVGIAWTAVNFGGSNTIEKATGALPILNTDGGGKVARVGVRTDSNFSNLKLAVPFVGVATDVVQQINGNSASMTSFTANNATFAVHPTDGAPYGTGLYLNSVSDYPNINYAAGAFNFLHNRTGSGTVEFWMYNGAYNTEAVMLTSIAGSPDIGIAIQMASSTTLQAVIARGVTGSSRTSGTASIPQNAWSHIAVTKTINGSNAELKLYVNGVLSASNTSITASDLSNSNSTYSYFRIGQNIGDETGRGWTNYYMNDLRIYDTVKYTQNFIPASTDPDILPDTPSGVAYSSNVALVPSTDGGSIALNGRGDYLKTVSASSDFAMGTGNFTIEMFIYPQTIAVSSPGILSWSSTEGTTTDYTNAGFIAYGSNGTIDVLLGTNSSYASISTPTSGPLLKFNSWNHIAIVRDTGNTFRVFVNGELAVTDTSTLASTNITAQYMNFGAYYTGTNYMVRGFISNVHVVKGTALYSSNFTPPVVGIASTTNTKLLFAKSGISTTTAEVIPSGVTIGIAGTARVTNFNPFTANINTQRGQESGYATLNPVRGYLQTLSNGNLTGQTAGGWVGSTIDVSSGKYYVEFTPTENTVQMFGICSSEHTTSAYPWQTAASKDVTYYVADGRIYVDALNTGTTSGAAIGDTISFAFDTNSREVKIYKNNVLLSTKTISQSSSYMFYLSDGGATSSANVNFGQKPFKFPPPAGFQPLALANTPRSTIVRPDQYVGVTTYTGNDSNPRSFANLGWKPDFVWIKNRSQSYNHVLFDSVRGTGGSKVLFSNRTTAEGGGTGEEGTAYGHISSFDNYGFTVNTGTTSDIWVNNNNENYVAWCWKAGGNSNTYNINDIGYSTASAAGLTAGTITPTGASVNTKSGFSIITWTGTSASGTVPHGLGIKPSFIIGRRRNGVANWCVYHISTGASQGLNLQSTAAAFANTTRFGGVEPTSTVFSVGSSGDLNAGDALAYCWTEIFGFSKFGSYTGNSSADGPVIITGFKPRWIMIKSSTSTYGWYIYDTARDPYNISGKELLADEGSAEVSDSDIDILSNGFKLRRSSLAFNTSSNTFIYAAFAEAPTFNLYGGQSNAR